MNPDQTFGKQPLDFIGAARAIISQRAQEARLKSYMLQRAMQSGFQSLNPTDLQWLNDQNSSMMMGATSPLKTVMGGDSAALVQNAANTMDQVGNIPLQQTMDVMGIAKKMLDPKALKGATSTKDVLRELYPLTQQGSGAVVPFNVNQIRPGR